MSVCGVRQIKLPEVFQPKFLNTSFSHVLKGYLPDIFSKVDLRPAKSCTVASLILKGWSCDVFFPLEVQSKQWLVRS